jgi:hypothetical protein
MINKLWFSKDESLWNKALDSYFSSGLIKKDNMILERKIDNLDPVTIKDMSTEQFYDWLYNVYFVWKYTAANRLATTRKSLSRYKFEKSMHRLEQIHFDLFTFDINDINAGLKIANSIHGLGIAGASGLLAVLYPRYFGTVDQFVVKALREIESHPEKDLVSKMNPDNLTIKDGILLIKIMKYKADELNSIFNTNKWTARDINKILWAARSLSINNAVTSISDTNSNKNSIKHRTYWEGTWKQMGAEKFRGTKDGVKPACHEFKRLSVNTQNDIFNIRNLFEVIVNTEESVLVLTFWHPAYPGSSVEGYEYMAVEYDESGNFIYSTKLFSFDDKNAGKVKIKNTSGAKKLALELLNEFNNK